MNTLKCMTFSLNQEDKHERIKSNHIEYIVKSEKRESERKKGIRIKKKCIEKKM